MEWTVITKIFLDFSTGQTFVCGGGGEVTLWSRMYFASKIKMPSKINLCFPSNQRYFNILNRNILRYNSILHHL